MQTSKSYGRNQASNVEIKLELEDLEYIFADGQNLVIKPNSPSQESQESNIIYTGSQTVVLDNSVKHLIRTENGETYLVDNDNENVQQLVINEDDEVVSNDAIEYIEENENVETIVYNLPDDKSEIEQRPKRFKLGNVEYVSIPNSETLQINEETQYGVIDDEDAVPQSEEFQYAILKDGKLHFQLCEADSIQILNDDTSEEQIAQQEVEETELVEDEEYIVDKDKIQEYVLINTEESPKEHIDVSKIIGKDLLTGKTVTLNEYLGHMQNNVNQSKNDENLREEPITNPDEYLNKKVLIRKNPNGKSLFGKILSIEQVKKPPVVDDPSNVEIHDSEVNDTILLHIETEYISSNEENCDANGEVISGRGHIETDKEASEEQMNYLSKILNGLSDMPNLKKKLMGCGLEIKYIERTYDSVTNNCIDDVRFVNGCLMQQENGFIISDEEKDKNTTSITVTVSQETTGKTTNVIFHEKQIQCPICQRLFQTINLLKKHALSSHIDRSLSCNVCLARFNNNVLLTEHRKSEGHYFNCETCARRFTTQSSLRRHQSTHEPNTKNLQCVMCQEQFPNISSLSKHLSTHTHIKAYQCECCGKAFATLNDLNLHKRSHNPVKMCYCDICGREFSRYSNLLRHTEIHKGNGELYKCGVCDCSYKFISSLTRHIVQNHMKQTL